MRRRMLELTLVCACVGASPATLQAQEFRLLDRTIQVHGFLSQGFVYTNDNNWLTMNTSQGSAAFTDFGVNLSTHINDKLQVGAQGYDRNLGQLGQYHPSLDWAVADYRFKTWFGVRGGKVKTTLGLYNDTQDLDFLHTFALLPQSVYPIDLALVFTGRASMPRELGSDAEVVAYVARTRCAIGYVSADTNTEGVKTLAIVQPENNTPRRLITRIEPDYPETLKRLGIGGTVRLQVTISAKGNVQNVELLGGNPILGESAISAVKQWVYATSHSRTVAEVSIPFDSHR
jgi:TonB family protein